MFRLTKRSALILIISSIIFTSTLVVIRLNMDAQKRQAQMQKTVKEKILKDVNEGSNINEGPYNFPQNLPKQKQEQFSGPHKKIYDYMEDIWDNYESIYPGNKAEALVFIEASKEFQKPIIEIFRAFTLMQNDRSGLSLRENEIDVLGMRRLKMLGFKKMNYKWYYDEMLVNVGNALPIPESMKPQKAAQGKQLIVKLDVTPIISEFKHVRFTGKTNLPTDMQLMLRLELSEIGYMAQDRVTINNGEFTSDWFSDAGRPGNRLISGKYRLVITSPTVNVQKASVKAILGEQAKNMKGQYIKFDPIHGNMMRFRTTFNIP